MADTKYRLLLRGLTGEWRAEGHKCSYFGGTLDEYLANPRCKGARVLDSAHLEGEEFERYVDWIVSGPEIGYDLESSQVDKPDLVSLERYERELRALCPSVKWGRVLGGALVWDASRN